MEIESIIPELPSTSNSIRWNDRFIDVAGQVDLQLDRDSFKGGYEVDGTPITQEALLKEAREASAQIKSGNYITQEDLEKEVKNW